MTGRIQGKVVVVTGASRGIGGSIAVAFAREGAQVVGAARSSMNDVAVEASGGKFHGVNIDLGGASKAEIDSFVGDGVRRFGRLDALSNNAGILRRAPAL